MSSKDEGKGAPEPEETALGDKARKSVEKSLAAERKENAPEGNTKAGLPAETDFTTPREGQGDVES